jgi:hypothetical protein
MSMTNATDSTGVLYIPQAPYRQGECTYATQHYGLGLDMTVSERDSLLKALGYC